MNRQTLVVAFLGLLVGAVLGVSLPSRFGGRASEAQSPAIPEKSDDVVAALRAEVERLKQVVPDQAHAMMDVDYHFTNLWFAAKAQNWPLADFYWKETLSHLRWAVRIIPVRKDSAGRDVNLVTLLESIENADSLKVADVIKAQDAARFEQTYRGFLEACYACHKASEKPFLLPRVPEQPASGIINFDPKATWPR